MNITKSFIKVTAVALFCSVAIPTFAVNVQFAVTDWMAERTATCQFLDGQGKVLFEKSVTTKGSQIAVTVDGKADVVPVKLACTVASIPDGRYGVSKTLDVSDICKNSCSVGVTISRPDPKNGGKSIIFRNDKPPHR